MADPVLGGAGSTGEIIPWLSKIRKEPPPFNIQHAILDSMRYHAVKYLNSGR